MTLSRETVGMIFAVRGGHAKASDYPDITIGQYLATPDSAGCESIDQYMTRCLMAGVDIYDEVK